MSNKPAFPESGTIPRPKIIEAMNLLGIDENQVKSVHIDANAVTVVAFDFNEDGHRYFAKRRETYAQYVVSLEVTDE